MIENKLITIKKNNCFDKGWALFSPFELNVLRNKEYKAISPAEIVRTITYSTSVGIILSEPCLARNIIKELEWANKYIEIRAIVKDKSILTNYASLTFANVTVDDGIDFNYIGVIGKQALHVVIGENYTQIDDAIWQTFFEKNKPNNNLSFLQSASLVIILDVDGKKDYSQVIAECNKRNIGHFYIVSDKSFCKDIFDKIKPPTVLCVAESLKNGIIVVTKEGKLYCVNMAGGVYFTSEIEKVSFFLDKVYKSLRLSDTVATSQIPAEAFVCLNGKLQQLSIKPKKVIERKVNVADMADFILENFDYSEVDSHNDYSAEAKTVEYNFTLIPPIFDSAYKPSLIYDGINTLYKKWLGLQAFDLLDLKKQVDGVCLRSDLSKLCEKVNANNQWLKRAVEEYDYQGFHAKLQAFSKLLEEGISKLLYYFEQIFIAVNSQTSDKKFSKLDEEIAGYRQTIAEKQALIDNGIEVLSNKRRIERLERTIQDLLELKKGFESGSSARDEKALAQFVEKCKAVLNDNIGSCVKSDESIGNVLQTAEGGKREQLDNIVDVYLLSLKSYLVGCMAVIDALYLEDVPEEYQVFDKQKQRYIVIDELAEFSETEGLRDKYNLKCATRR